MKRLLLSAVVVLLTTMSFSQSLVSISPATANLGDSLTLNVAGSGTTWTLATPTVKLYNTTGDTIADMGVSVVDDLNVTASFYIDCSVYPAGTYSVMTNEATNGTLTLDTVLSIVGMGSPTFNNTNPYCAGNADGILNFAGLVGGTAPYTYAWFSDAGLTQQIGTGAAISNYAAGTYYIQVTDFNNCTFSASTMLSDPIALQMAVTSNGETCFGTCDGSATATPSGGTAPYAYTWSAGPTTQTASALCAGTYAIDVVDVNGCAISDSVSVTGPSQLGYALSGGNVTCAGLNNGTIDFTGMIGGTTPYQYSIDGGTTYQSSSSFTGLAAGTYVTYMQDANGCFWTDSIALTAPGSALVLDTAMTIVNASCNGSSDGQMFCGVTGGTAPYTLQWSNGLYSDTLTHATAGTYTLFVTDATGCSASASGTITEPAAMSVSDTLTAPTCGLNDGSAEILSVSGGTAPFTYAWTNGASTALVSGLEAGTYVVTIEDVNGCSVTETINLASSTAPSVAVNTTSPSCNGGVDGAINLTLTGGTAPITFDWSTGAQTEDITNLRAGIYDVTIQDASGCEISKIVTVPVTPQLDLSAVTYNPANCGLQDGDITVIAAGGTAPYAYSWSSGGTASQESGLAAGTYTLTVTDANACVKSKTYALSNVNSPSITVDQVVQPACEGGDGMIAVSVSGGTTPYTYDWSDGTHNQNLVSAVVGNYQLTITDGGGCQAVAYAELHGINLSAAEICMVTVDTVTDGNIVVWTKDYGLGIAEYEIYRETAVYNQFQYLGTVPFDSLSQYLDTTANPDVHSYKYKVRTIDSCANASDFLALHKTIHLNAVLNTSNEVELNWDDYIGIAYTDFHIYRNHPTTGWQEIAVVASTVHNYTDPNYPSITGLDYSIVVIPSSPCTAEKSQDHNSTRSNKVNIAPGVPTDAGISSSDMSYNVYPNPTKGILNLRLSSQTSNVEVIMQDLNGKVVKLFNVGQQPLHQLDISDLESGVYFLDVRIDGASNVTKVVKN